MYVKSVEKLISERKPQVDAHFVEHLKNIS
jgi:hypothetical protein